MCDSLGPQTTPSTADYQGGYNYVYTLAGCLGVLRALCKSHLLSLWIIELQEGEVPPSRYHILRPGINK